MTVAMRADAFSIYDLPDLYASAIDLYGANGCLLTVTSEQPGDHGEVNVTLSERWGKIHSDLSIGANVSAAFALQSNENLSNRGVQLFGAGFMVKQDEASLLLPLLPGEGRGEGSQPSHSIIREYRNGRDLTDTPRGVKVIDAFGLSAEQLRAQFPAIYQWLLERVKPERDLNNRASRRDNWWLFGETNPKLRKQLAGLTRYIATVETAKHRTFQFIDATILPDNMLVAIASKEAFCLGVLSSNIHISWALAQGGTLEDRPRYNKSRCFETFPFPDEDTGLTPELRNRIAALAEQIDAHRKRQQAAHAGLTLTGVYNALEALKAERELTVKDKAIHTQGLVGVLKELHDELDTAVLQAYGWSDLTPGQAQGEREGDELLTRLVALNAQRAAEERGGKVRWLRPEFQNPAAYKALQNQELPKPVIIGQQADLIGKTAPLAATGNKTDAQAWPATLPEQVRAVAQVLASAGAALSLSALEALFKGKGPWKKGLPRLLETLEALGRARREGDDWRG